MSKSPGRRQNSKASNSRRDIVKRLLILLIGVYVVWVGYNYVSAVFKATMVRTSLVTYDVIQSTMPFEGLIIRDETVLSVPSSGKIDIIAAEGERVRVGALVSRLEVADLNSSGGTQQVNLWSPVAGIVSYSTDGMEGILQPANLDKMDLYEAWRQTPSQEQVVQMGEPVEAGQSVAKVVNNLTSVIIIGELEQDKEYLEKLQSTKKVLIQFGPENPKPVSLNLLDLKPVGDKVRVTLEMNNFADKFINYRIQRFSIIKERYEGYIVPRGAIVYQEDEPGVYEVYKKMVRWRPVEIEGEIGQKVAVSGLNPKTIYVENPQYVKVGQAIK